MSTILVQKFKRIRPSFSNIRKEHCGSIMNLSGRFFLVQISVVIIYSTDSFLINYFFSSEDVTVYNVVMKYFMVSTVICGVALEPFWSAFSQAGYLDDRSWIKKTYIKLRKVSLLCLVVLVVMYFISDLFFLMWLGEEVLIPNDLILIMAVNAAIHLLLQPAITLINGLGKIKIQVGMSMFSAFVNIPLSILIAVNLDFGVKGILLATVLTRMIGLFFI